MKNTYKGNTLRTVKTKSNRWGWRTRLQNCYKSYEEFKSYNIIFGIVKRLDYRGAQKCWNDNPVIEGSTNPEDFCFVSK